MASIKDYKQPIRYEAVIQDSSEELPNMKRATIVLTNDADKIFVGVKAVGRIYERLDNGGLKVHEEYFGDYTTVNKSEPISKIFDALKQMFENTEKLIEEANKDVKA